MNSFREMTVSDLPAVFAVRVSTTENSISMAVLAEDHEITPKTLAESMQESMRGWVCEVDGAIVGFAMGESESGEVTVLAVRPDYERRGIGKNLMELVQSWLFAAGHEQIWLLTTPNPNFRAYGFYQSLGWQATGEILDGDDERFVLNRQREAV